MGGDDVAKGGERLPGQGLGSEAGAVLPPINQIQNRLAQCRDQVGEDELRDRGDPVPPPIAANACAAACGASASGNDGAGHGSGGGGAPRVDFNQFQVIIYSSPHLISSHLIQSNLSFDRILIC